MHLDLVVAALVAASLLHPAATRAADPHYVPDFMCVTGKFALTLPPTYPELRRIGKIRSEEILEATDWGAYRSILRQIRLDGLNLEVITFSNDPAKYFPVRITVTTPAWHVTGPLSVGLSLAEARHRLAERDVTLPDDLQFGGDTDILTLHASNELITQITYTCYTG